MGDPSKLTRLVNSHDCWPSLTGSSARINMSWNPRVPIALLKMAPWKFTIINLLFVPVPSCTAQDSRRNIGHRCYCIRSTSKTAWFMLPHVKLPSKVCMESNWISAISNNFAPAYVSSNLENVKASSIATTLKVSFSFLGYTATDQNIVCLDLDTGIVKQSHHAQFDEAWYLQDSRPPAA